MNNRRAITIILLIANLCLFVISVSAWIKPAAQSKKTIIRRLTLSKEPVAISFTLKGQPVNASEAVRTEEGIRVEEFEGDPDWVRDLTLKLRNTSDQTITYIALDLHFPDVTRNGRTALHQIFLGVDPDGKFQRAELRLAPHQTIEVPLAERYDNIKNLVEKVGNTPLGNITKLWVEFHSALFEDGTLFEAGTLYRRNPDQSDSRKWLKIDKP
jgi:hypothetical protein